MNLNNVLNVDPNLLNQRPHRSLEPDTMKTQADHTDALQFVGEALQLYVEELRMKGAEGETMILEEIAKLNQAICDKANGEVIGSRLDALHEIICSLVKASNDLVEGAQAQANEYAEELRRLTETRPTVAAKSTHIAVDVISEEISRRTKAIEKLSGLQEDFEDQRAELASEIETIDELLKHSEEDADTDKRKLEKIRSAKQMQSLDIEIRKLIETRDQYEQTIGELKRYDEAMKIVKRGLAPEIFGEDMN